MPRIKKKPIITVYVEPGKENTLWDKLYADKDTRVTCDDENLAPHGVQQKNVVAFLKSHRKVTARNIIDYLVNNKKVDASHAAYIVSNCLNKGVIEVIV